MEDEDSYLTRVSRVRMIIQQFYWLITFFCFNWEQICLTSLVTPENCTKMLRNLTFVIQFEYFSIRPKEFLFSRATFEQFSLHKATFDCFLNNVWASFLEITGNVWENLEQLVESPIPPGSSQGKTNKKRWIIKLWITRVPKTCRWRKQQNIILWKTVRNEIYLVNVLVKRD